MASPLLGNLGAKFSKTSFPHFTTSFTQIDHCLTFRWEFKAFDFNNYTLSVYLSVCLSVYLDICKITWLCEAIFPLSFNASPLHLVNSSILRCSFLQCQWLFTNWSESKVEKKVEGSMSWETESSLFFKHYSNVNTIPVSILLRIVLEHFKKASSTFSPVKALVSKNINSKNTNMGEYGFFQQQ